MNGDTQLVSLAREVADDDYSVLSAAADRRTRELVDGFVHESGPPPAQFAWLALGSHARGELHCASDQDHALVWADERAASSRYATDLADRVIAGLADFGLRRCAGGYMADAWSRSLSDWVELLRQRIDAPTPEAVLDTDVFLDLRPVVGTLDVGSASAVLQSGAASTRLMHGLARAANSFGVPMSLFGRLPREVDLKRAVLTPTVLLARLYGLRARSDAVDTLGRLEAAVAAEALSDQLGERLAEGFRRLTSMRIRHQLQQASVGARLSDRIRVPELPAADQAAVRDALRAVKATQSATGLTYRTDLDL